MKKNLFLLFFLIHLGINAQESTKPNIIMVIGDGMGLSAISSGMYSNNNYTSLERSEFIGLSKTHSYDNLITDSAASATAMASGVKTFNKVIGLDSDYKSVKTILEICMDLGYSSGIVVTSSIVHASPASYYAKEKSRYNYNEIANQLSKKGVNFFVGGGEKYFIERPDGKNLMNEMKEYFFAKNIDEYRNNKSDKIGFFTSFDEPIEKHKGREPALDEIVDATLSKFDSINSPFFLLIEGSQIDWGSHDNDQPHMISEMIELDNTLDKVFDYAEKNKNTLVIITADHETGGAAITGGNLVKSSVVNRYVSGSHTGTMVPVFSFGPNSSYFKGIYDNTEIFNKLLSIVK